MNLIPALIITTLPTVLAGLTWKNQLEVTTGVIVEQLPLPIIYETFVPLILEYKLPIINSSDLSTEKIFHRNCTSSDYYPNSPCPTAYYLKEELSRFYQFFKESRSPPEVSQSSYGGKFNWNDMEETFNIFQSSFAVNDAVNQFIDQLLEDSPLNLFYLERDIKEFSSVNITDIENMMNGFYEQYWKEISSDRIDDALYSNAISLYQAMILQQHVMDIVRWNRVIEDCSINKIPRGFVKEEKLRAILDDLQKNLTKQLYELALTGEDHYYRHKLASCVTTPTSLFVTIRVPIAKNISSSNIEFFKAHSVPFITPKEANTTESVCRVNSQHDGEYFISNTRLGYVRPSTCQPFKLCPIPGYWDYGTNDLCLSAVRELNGTDIAQHCPVSCIALEDLQLQRYPLITQVTGNSFILTGRTDGTLVKCLGQEDAKVPTNKIGAMTIKLHPHCKIRVDQGRSSENLRTLSGNVIIPVHWTADKKIGPVSSIDLNFEYQGGASNDGMNLGSQYLNHIKVHNVPAENSNSAIGTGLELAWMSLLTIGLLAGFAYVYIIGRKIKNDVDQTGRKESVVYLTSPNASDLLGY